MNVDLLGVAQPIDSLLQMTGTPVNTATQTNGTANLSETVVTPAPSLYQAGNASQLLAKLSSGSVYNLNDTSSALNDDLAWAFQWDATLASSGLGSTFLVSKDKQLDVVPEPSTLVLPAPLPSACSSSPGDGEDWRRETSDAIGTKTALHGGRSFRWVATPSRSASTATSVERTCQLGERSRTTAGRSYSNSDFRMPLR